MRQSEAKRLWYIRNRSRILEEAKEYRERNKDRQKRHVANWVSSNRARSNEIKRAWAHRNKEKDRECKRAYDKANPYRKKFHLAHRRARLMNATPAWLSKAQKEEIRAIYASCPPGYEVDHIVPLKGDGVSGLHVPWNLRHLTRAENRRKRNKYE